MQTTSRVSSHQSDSTTIVGIQLESETVDSPMTDANAAAPATTGDTETTTDAILSTSKPHANATEWSITHHTNTTIEEVTQACGACNSHGDCDAETFECQCHLGCSGDQCEQHLCNHHGTILAPQRLNVPIGIDVVEAVCQCHAGFTGAFCDTLATVGSRIS